MERYLTSKLVILRLIALFCFILGGFPIGVVGKTHHVLILSGTNEAPYQEVIDSFKKNLSSQNNDVSFTEVNQASGASEIETIKPSLIFALGSEAVSAASRKTSSIPIIGTMVLKDADLRQGGNVTGVALNHSLRTQFQWLKKFFPQQNTVAILYNPSENDGAIREAEQISRQNSFKLVAIPVESPRELPFALERLEQNVEVLLAIPDDTVMSINTAKEVLLSSFRNKVPLIGLSDNWVKSGALYALSWDYPDLGQQCAGQASKILAGTPVSAISPEHPRKVTYTINTKIAEHMDINIPDSLRRNAKMVFQ